MMDIPEEYGGPGLSVLARSIVEDRAVAHRRAAGARHGGIAGPSVRAILYRAQGRDEGEISAAGVARREEGLLRADRTRRRLRSGRHAHRRGARRRPLRHQRRQALHHRRRRRRLHAAHGGDRPRQGLARRHLLLHRRHEYAGREVRHAVQDHDGRPALGDRARKRARAGRAIGSAKRAKVSATPSNGSAPAACATAPARSASPSAASNWRPPTPSNARPSAGRSPTGRPSNGCWPTCISSCRRRGFWSTRPRFGSTTARTPARTPMCASISADEMAFKAADMCMQIHGGIALTTDLPIEKVLAAAAQLPHHRRRQRSDENGHRPPRPENLRVSDRSAIGPVRRPPAYTCARAPHRHLD